MMPFQLVNPNHLDGSVSQMTWESCKIWSYAHIRQVYFVTWQTEIWFMNMEASTFSLSLSLSHTHTYTHSPLM